MGNARLDSGVFLRNSCKRTELSWSELEKLMQRSSVFSFRLTLFFIYFLKFSKWPLRSSRFQNSKGLATQVCLMPPITSGILRPIRLTLKRSSISCLFFKVDVISSIYLLTYKRVFHLGQTRLTSQEGFYDHALKLCCFLLILLIGKVLRSSFFTS